MTFVVTPSTGSIERGTFADFFTHRFNHIVFADSLFQSASDDTLFIKSAYSRLPHISVLL